jgi:hypothetical protein
MAIRIIRIAPLLLILAVISHLSGCAHKPPEKEEPPPGSFLEDIYATNNTKTDLEMFSKAMPPYLQYLDGLILPQLEDSKVFCRVSGAYYGYAFCFVEDKDRKEASSLYRKGRDLSFNELMRYRIFNHALTYKQPIETFRQALVESFNQSNVPLVYWTAMNWTGWICLNMDKPDAVEDIPRVEAMLEFVNTFNDSYGNGSVHAALGTLYALQSKDAGGDPDRAKQEFEKAFSCSFSSILPYPVLYARYYAYRIKDKELFRTTLTSVVEKPADFYPDMNFLNEVAKKKANSLLKNTNRYFKEAPKKTAVKKTPPKKGTVPATPKTISELIPLKTGGEGALKESGVQQASPKAAGDQASPKPGAEGAVKEPSVQQTPPKTTSELLPANSGGEGPVKDTGVQQASPKAADEQAQQKAGTDPTPATTGGEGAAKESGVQQAPQKAGDEQAPPNPSSEVTPPATSGEDAEKKAGGEGAAQPQ